MVEQQQQRQVEVSSVVQQALGKLNVRMADLLEQINIVINVLFEEYVVLRAKLEELSFQQLRVEEVKK
jgi:hypothetical protein